MLDLGLLLLRVVVGLLLAAHGAQKLFGWFGGDGLAATGQGFAGLGYPNATVMAAVAGLTELAAGLGLAAGVLVPFAAAGVIGTMVNAAVAAHGKAGLWAQNGGYEYPLVLGAVAAGLAIHGPGRYAIDPALGLELGGLTWGVGAIVVGVLAALAVLGSRRTQPSSVGS